MREFLSKEGSTENTFGCNTNNKESFFQAKPETEQQEKFSCAGWESDPQSFCIVVGKKFLIYQFSMSPAAESVETEDDGGCHVFFEGGIVLSVQRLPGQEVVVYVTPSTTNKKVGSRFCYYTYSCNVNGTLELTQTRCSGKGRP